MKRIYFILIIILFNLSANTQIKGFLGKENFIAISMPIHIEIASFLRTYSKYDKSNEQIIQHYDGDFSKLFSLGFNAEYYRILSRKSGIGLEYNYFRRSLFLYDYGDFGSYSFTVPRANVSTYKAYYTYSAQTSFLPIGIRHKLALGYQLFNLRTSSIFYQEHSFSSEVKPVIQLEDVPEGLEKSYKAIEFSYGATFSYAFSESMFFDVGLDLRIPFFLNNQESFQERKIQNTEILAGQPQSIKKKVLEDIYKHNSQNEGLKGGRFLDMLSFKIGISYAF